MTWTPELQKTAEIVAARLRAAMTQPDANPLHRDAHIVIIRTLDALESQQAELNAAREVVEAARMVGRFDEGDFSRVVDAVATYDAARVKQETT